MRDDKQPETESRARDDAMAVHAERVQRWETEELPPTGGEPDPQSLTYVLSRIGRIVATAGLKNVAAIFALTGLVFYLVGLTRRVAILEAEQIPTTRGIPVASLQDYLVQGLAVVIEPTVLLWGLFWLVTLFVLVVLTFHRQRAGARSIAKRNNAPTAEHRGSKQASVDTDDNSSERPADAAGAPHGVIARGARKVGLWLITALALLGAGFMAYVLVMLIAATVFLPPAAWAPWALTLVPVFVAWAVYKTRRMPPWTDWGPRHAALVGGTLTSMLVTYVFATAWLAPPPLDRATITLKSGKTCDGGFLASANGAIYLVRPTPLADCGLRLEAVSGTSRDRADIVAFPLGDVKSAEVVGGQARRYNSLASMFGWVDEKWSSDRPCSAYPGFVKRLCEGGDQ